MALLTFGTILFLPFALPLVVPGLRADPWTIARPLVLLIILPLCIGMFVKSRAPVFAGRTAPVFGNIANAALLLFSLVFIAPNAGLLPGLIGDGTIIITMIYFASLFIMGWLLAGSRRPEVRGVMGLATTGRNFGIALVPAAGGFNDPKVTIMIVVSAVVCSIVSFTAAGWARRTTLTSHAR
jgi:BASS family bile acid:Na+ symporter